MQKPSVGAVNSGVKQARKVLMAPFLDTEKNQGIAEVHYQQRMRVVRRKGRELDFINVTVFFIPPVLSYNFCYPRHTGTSSSFFSPGL